MPIAAIIDEILEEFFKQINTMKKKKQQEIFKTFMMPVVYQETFCNLVSHLNAPPERKYTGHTVTTGFYNSFISLYLN